MGDDITSVALGSRANMGCGPSCNGCHAGLQRTISGRWPISSPAKRGAHPSTDPFVPKELPTNCRANKQAVGMYNPETHEVIQTTSVLHSESRELPANCRAHKQAVGIFNPETHEVIQTAAVSHKAA